MFLFLALCLFLESASADGNYGQHSPNSHSVLMRSRRQATMDNLIYCGAVASRAQCSTSYAQKVINDISKCGNRATIAINTIEASCRKDDVSGLFCGEAVSYVSGNCTAATCTAACSKSLRLAGCCVNDGESSYTQNLTTCNIPMPSSCPRSNLRIPDIVQDNSCSSEKRDEIFF